MSKINYKKALSALAPELNNAIANVGKHVKCPLPGHERSKDGFRLFFDFPQSGGGVCNTCGIFANGVLLLSYIKSIRTSEAYKQLLEAS